MRSKATTTGRRPIYPWATWERARSFVVTGKEYRGAPHGLAQQIRNKFNADYRVSISISGRTLTVRLT